MQYIPTKLNSKTIALDKADNWQECLDYAIKHKLNVVFDDVTNSDVIRVMYEFQNKGFEINLSEIKAIKTDGSKENRIICEFVNGQ